MNDSSFFIFVAFDVLEMLCAGVVARFIFFDLRGRVLGASAVDVMQLDPTMSKHALRFGEGCVNLCCSVHAHVPCMYITKDHAMVCQIGW